MGNRSVGGPELPIAVSRRGKLPTTAAARGRDDYGPGPGSQPAALAGPIGQLPVGSRFHRQRHRQHPDLSSSPPSADYQRVLVLTLLAIDGVLCAIMASFFLPTYIGSWPFPRQRADRRPGQCRVGVGCAALGHIAADGSATAGHLAADRGCAVAGRAGRRHRVRRARDHGVRGTAAPRSRHAATGRGAVAFHERLRPTPCLPCCRCPQPGPGRPCSAARRRLLSASAR